MFFSCLDWGYRDLGENNNKCRIHHIIPRIHTIHMTLTWRQYQHDVNLDHLAEVAFVSFLHCKVIPPPPLLCKLESSEENHYPQPTFKEGEAVLHLLKGGVSTFTIWNSSAPDSCLFCLVYLLIQSFIYNCMDIYYIPWVCMYFTWRLYFFATLIFTNQYETFFTSII